MNILDKITDRLIKKDACNDQIDFINETREILQEIILNGLARTDFFDNNAFHGGTAIRLLYGLERYSKDLDFNLKVNDKNFKWEKYVEPLEQYAKSLGFEIKCIIEKPRANVISMKIQCENMLQLIETKNIVDRDFTFYHGKKPKVKLETGFHADNFIAEEKSIMFPSKCSIMAFDRHCLFAGKINAILTREKTVNGVKCREDVGRDYYDLVWYVNQSIEPNYAFLQAKLKDSGYPYNERSSINTEWIKNELSERIKGLNYEELDMDIKEIIHKNNKISKITARALKDAINNLGANGFKYRYIENNDMTCINHKIKNDKLSDIVKVNFILIVRI